VRDLGLPDQHARPPARDLVGQIRARARPSGRGWFHLCLFNAARWGTTGPQMLIKRFGPCRRSALRCVGWQPPSGGKARPFQAGLPHLGQRASTGVYLIGVLSSVHGHPQRP
jgi:hypothetical protein